MLKSILCFFLDHNLLKLTTFSDYTTLKTCKRCEKKFHVDRIGVVNGEWDDILESIYEKDRGPYY